MSTTVTRLNRDNLEDRRRALLARIDLTDAELADRAAQYTLTPDQADVLEELEMINFLLGHE